MKADLFYSTVLGRTLFKVLQKMGFFRLAAWFLRTHVSKHMIPGFIKKYDIDMSSVAVRRYESFASFFARERGDMRYVIDPDVLISPCDGLLSVYPVTEDMELHMKGSSYTLKDLVPDEKTAELFRDGLCLVFRLEVSDYHHFCFFDDGLLIETKHIPGQLHSVQPIAHRYVPVFRLNRRWWSVMETKNFGTAVQIEVGAVLIGGVSFSIGDGWFERGDDMGCFELAGSTIVLLLNSCTRNRLDFQEAVLPAVSGMREVRVQMGSAIGILKNEE